MENTATFVQSDWSGGENTLLQPELLQENEASKIVNLLPLRDTAGLSLRKGFERIYEALGDRVYDVFVKRMKSGTSYLFAVVLDGTDIVLKNYGVMKSAGGDIVLDGNDDFVSVDIYDPTPTTVHTFVQTDASWFRGVQFCDWEDDKFFFTDGVNPLMVYSHAEFNRQASETVPDYTKSCTVVTDKWSTFEEKPKMYGTFVTQVKGRLAIAEHGTSTIHICGSDDSRTDEDGNIVHRYESWSGTSAASGGAIDVTPYGAHIRGLAPAYGGLVVFKENGIHLWQWSDSDAPWNANTASVERISMGVSLVDHNTIVEFGTSLYFVGRNERGTLGVFKFDMSQETEVSLNIPAKMKKLVDSGSLNVKMYAAIVDGYYIILARDGGSSTVVAFFDLKTGAWVSIDSPAVSCLHKPVSDSFVLTAGSTGALLKYPGKHWVDDVSTPIPWEVQGGRLTAGDEYSEKYWRVNWVDAAVNRATTLNMELLLDNGRKMTCSPITITPTATHLWGDGVLWGATGVVWEAASYNDKYFLETGERSFGATYRVWGTSSDWLRINRVGVGFRGRRVMNVYA